MDDFASLLQYIFAFSISATLGSVLVWKSKRAFLFIRPELLRRNVVTFFIGLFFFFAVGHLIPDFRNILENFGWGWGLLLCCLVIVLDVLIPYNLVLYITEGKRFSRMDFIKQQVLIFFGIVATTVVVNGIMNYFMNNSTRYLKYSVVWSFYMAGLGSLIYLFTRYYDLDRKKKLYAKELEVARLSEAKTKAELDALHSKINPHFLYNALNSIADLTMTDGKKARRMTLSLADLFRYNMNYSQSNFATVQQELETAKLYLDIEKIRFEDRLRYEISADDASLPVQVPKFLLQPLIENAVKHGLKKTSQLTVVCVQVQLKEAELTIRIEENGPPFPAEFTPGYGLKSVYDKLELLYPGRFDIKMVNTPEKYLQVVLQQTIPVLHEV